MIRILIADDHMIVREGLKQILSQVPGMTVAGEADDGHQALSMVCRKNYDIVVLDISMPGRTGLETLKDMKREKPKLPVLVLSMHPEEQYAVRALKDGASGYITKESVSDELVKAIKTLSEGKKYLTPGITEKLILEFNSDFKKPLHETLSDREYQVLCMIASGKTVKEIAQEIFLSDKTVSTYRFRILQKMQMNTNAELTHYALKQRLVE